MFKDFIEYQLKYRDEISKTNPEFKKQNFVIQAVGMRGSGATSAVSELITNKDIYIGFNTSDIFKSKNDITPLCLSINKFQFLEEKSKVDSELLTNILDRERFKLHSQIQYDSDCKPFAKNYDNYEFALELSNIYNSVRNNGHLLRNLLSVKRGISQFKVFIDVSGDFHLQKSGLVNNIIKFIKYNFPMTDIVFILTWLTF